MAKTIVVVLVALSAACSTVQARRTDGHTLTCIPVRAMDRGPFEATPSAGAVLITRETPVGFFASVLATEHATGKRYSCLPNSAMDRGPFQPATPAGETLVVR